MRVFYQLTLSLAFIASLVAIGTSIGIPGGEFRSAVFLPAAYLVFLTMIAFVTWRFLPSPFLIVALFSSFLRYVGFPILASLNGGYVGRSHTPPALESYDIAVVLMCYELTIVGFSIFFLEKKYQRLRAKSLYSPVKSLPSWYTLAIGVTAVAAILLFPQAIFLLSFISFGFELDELSLPATISLAAMLFMSAKVFMTLKIVHQLSQTKRWAIFAPYFAMIIGLANIFVYFGTNRMAVVLTAVTTGWILFRTFGSRARTPIVILALSGLFVFSVITERRDYMHRTDDTLTKIVDQVQVYTGGMYNVAIGVEVREQYPEARRWNGLAFDFLRPTVGFNLIVQNWNIDYSNQYFNWRMFTHVDRRSQILPMIAQGNLYFGFIFAPLLPLLFVWLGYVLLGKIWQTQFIELRYAMLLIVLRLGFFWGQNTMNMMNFISLNFIIPLIMIAPYLYMGRYPQRTRVR